ncbi:MAG: FkbM family methyltransferase [Candidatus Geothermincolia bacterium]
MKQFINACGYDIRKNSLQNNEKTRKRKIINDLGINLVLDVGAAEGQYGSDLRRLGYRGRIISFEPLGVPFRKLKERAIKDGQWDSVNVALGDQDGRQAINVSGRVTSSSLLTMTRLHTDAVPASRYVGTEEISVRRLDGVFNKEATQPCNVFLKIDVQGYEMKVLDGAERTLPAVLGVEIEMSLDRLYQNGSDFGVVLSFLQDRGFKMVSVVPIFIDPNSGYVLQVDGIFVRK